MDETLRLVSPLTDEVLRSLNAGDRVLLSGTVYAARDAAHKRMARAIADGQHLPIVADGSPIYYVGPTPARPGLPIGSAGPTTSGRMDIYAPLMMKLGFKSMIGKGARSSEVVDAITKTGSVYFAAIGGAGALAARCILESTVVAYEDLGPEAVRKLVLQDFPLVVINDAHGRDLYKEGQVRFRRERFVDAV